MECRHISTDKNKLFGLVCSQTCAATREHDPSITKETFTKHRISVILALHSVNTAFLLFFKNLHIDEGLQYKFQSMSRVQRCAETYRQYFYLNWYPFLVTNFITYTSLCWLMSNFSSIPLQSTSECKLWIEWRNSIYLDSFDNTLNSVISKLSNE